LHERIFTPKFKKLQKKEHEKMISIWFLFGALLGSLYFVIFSTLTRDWEAGQIISFIVAVAMSIITWLVLGAW
jgi:lipopolysaccharide export LptBFGC system permease protein LptF